MAGPHRPSGQYSEADDSYEGESHRAYPQFMGPPPPPAAQGQQLSTPYDPDLASGSSRVDEDPAPARAAAGQKGSSSKKNKEKEKEKEKEDSQTAAEKRHRVHFSCSECHRRKQKCDRQQPCSNCVNRRIPHLCRTFDPVTDSSDINTRLSRLEKLVGDYLPAILERLDNPRSLGMPRFDTGHRPSIGAGSTEEEVHDDSRGTFGPSGMYIGSSTTGHAVGAVLENAPAQEFPVAAGQLTINARDGKQDIDSVLAEFGWPAMPGTTSASGLLVASMPPRSTCDQLVDHFFQNLNWLRHPLPQASLRKAFNQFFESGPVLTVENLNIFAILALMCSVASLSIESNVFTGRQHSRIVATRRLQWAARQALATSSAIGRGDADAVIAWQLMCRVLILERRQEEAAMASGTSIKLAQAIGLHRDGSKLKFGPAEAEYRRRIWTAVFTTECYLSWHMGRPSCLQRDAIDSQAPSEDDDDLYPVTIPRPPGTLEITAMTVHRFRHALGTLFLRISELQQALRPVPYNEVLAIDRELLDWRDSLPSHFKCPLGPTGAIEMDNSLDEYYPFLAPQRYLLESDFNQSRIGLHRPYLLLSRNKGGSRYLPSRRACVEAAHHDILHRSALVTSMGDRFDAQFIRVWNVHYHSTKHFSSVVICGIALLSDPSSAQAATLRGHLVQFLEIARLKEQHNPDSPFLEMYRREADIIRMFLQKVDELTLEPVRNRMRTMEESQAARKRALVDGQGDPSSKRTRSDSDRHEDSTAHSHDGDEHATASVLLGLSHSNPAAQGTPGSVNSQAGRSPVTDDAQNILDAWFAGGGYQQPANGLLDFGFSGLSASELSSLPPLANSEPQMNAMHGNGQPLTNSQYPAYTQQQQQNMNGVATTATATGVQSFPMNMASMGQSSATMANMGMAGPNGMAQMAGPSPSGPWNRSEGGSGPWEAGGLRNDNPSFESTYWQTLIDKIVK
ncbi:hypothetical protein V8E36_003035 [Tilletia maclaganii]